MSIKVRRFQPDDVPAIDRLNRRFAAGNVHHKVYAESATTPAESRGDPISHELYVAADDGEIRGGVWLHEHEFVHNGQSIRAGWLKYPVAESLINRDYGPVASAMLISVMRRQPEVMALGMGQRDTPYAQLLAALGWTIVDVPFYVAPVRVSKMVGLPQFRRSKVLARAGDVMARTGLATVAGLPFNLMRRTRSGSLLRGVEVTVVAEFGAWADEQWRKSREAYGFMARRDAAFLNRFYSGDTQWLTRLRVQRGSQDIGWVVVTLAPPGSSSSSYYLGDVRVGLLADALGDPEDAATLLAAGTRYLEKAGADVIVTNQIHPAWRAPLPTLGFVQRPTTFLFAYSKQLGKRITPQLAAESLFINRGDCDGPLRW